MPRQRRAHGSVSEVPESSACCSVVNRKSWCAMAFRQVLSCSSLIRLVGVSDDAAFAADQMSRSKRAKSALIVSAEAFPRSRPRLFVKATLNIAR